MREGSWLLGSSIVSMSAAWSPSEPEMDHSSSSATMLVLAICVSDVWNSATVMCSSSAISWSVGARCSRFSRMAQTFSISRALLRTERGTQSSERSSSMMEPLMREMA